MATIPQHEEQELIALLQRFAHKEFPPRHMCDELHSRLLELIYLHGYAIARSLIKVGLAERMAASIDRTVDELAPDR